MFFHPAFPINGNVPIDIVAISFSILIHLAEYKLEQTNRNTGEVDQLRLPEGLETVFIV